MGLGFITVFTFNTWLFGVPIQGWRVAACVNKTSKNAFDLSIAIPLGVVGKDH